MESIQKQKNRHTPHHSIPTVKQATRNQLNRYTYLGEEDTYEAEDDDDEMLHHYEQ